jgi:hypothetical protein
MEKEELENKIKEGEMGLQVLQKEKEEVEKVRRGIEIDMMFMKGE